MKTKNLLFSFLFCIVALILIKPQISFSEEPFCKVGREVSQAYERYCLVDVKSVETKTGPYEKRSDKGELLEKGAYLANEKDGKWLEFYPTGQKIEESTYSKGKLVGDAFGWHFDGKKRYEGKFDNEGNPIGKRIEWYENEQKSSETDYRNEKGVWYSIETKYFADGKKKAYVERKNGKLHGKEIFWYPNGNKNSEREFIDGEVKGLAKNWFINGNKDRFEIFTKSGIKNGKAEYFYENGKKKMDGTYVDNEYDGTWNFYRTDGNLDKQVKYRYGKFIKE